MITYSKEQRSFSSDLKDLWRFLLPILKIMILGVINRMSYFRKEMSTINVREEFKKNPKLMDQLFDSIESKSDLCLTRENILNIPQDYYLTNKAAREYLDLFTEKRVRSQILSGKSVIVIAFESIQDIVKLEKSHRNLKGEFGNSLKYAEKLNYTPSKEFRSLAGAASSTLGYLKVGNERLPQGVFLASQLPGAISGLDKSKYAVNRLKELGVSDKVINETRKALAFEVGYYLSDSILTCIGLSQSYHIGRVLRYIVSKEYKEDKKVTEIIKKFEEITKGNLNSNG